MANEESELLEMAQKIIKNYGHEVMVMPNGQGFQCPSCGMPLYEGDNYCRGCGKKLNWKYAQDTVLPHGTVIVCGINYEVTDIILESETGCTDGLTIKAKKIFPGEEDE